MSAVETMDVLPGEGETKTVVKTQRRRDCVNCGEPAHFKHSYLVPNVRRNPTSSAYGRDDCSWCSDHDEFTCKDCKRPRLDNYEWCSTFPAQKHFAHMFLFWGEEEAIAKGQS